MKRSILLIISLVLLMQIASAISIIEEIKVDEDVNRILFSDNKFLIYTKNTNDLHYYDINSKKSYLLQEKNSYPKFLLWNNSIYHISGNNTIITNLESKSNKSISDSNIYSFVSEVGSYKKINENFYVKKEIYYLDKNGKEVDFYGNSEINESELVKKTRYLQINLPNFKKENIEYKKYNEAIQKPTFENYERKIENGILFEKTSGENYSLKEYNINLNTVCGVSKDNLLFNKVVIIGKERNVFLVEYNYKTDQSKDIEIKNKCLRSEGYFFANPYLYDMYSGEKIETDLEYSNILLSKNNLVYSDKEQNLHLLKIKTSVPSADYNTVNKVNSYLEDEYTFILEECLTYNNIKAEVSKDNKCKNLFSGDIHYTKKSQIELLEKIQTICKGSNFETCEKKDSLLNQSFLEINSQVKDIYLLDFILSPNLEKYELTYSNNKSKLNVIISPLGNNFVDYPIKEVEFSNFKLSNELTEINEFLEDMEIQIKEHKAKKRRVRNWVIFILIILGLTTYLYFNLKDKNKLRKLKKNNKNVRAQIKEHEVLLKENSNKHKAPQKKNQEIENKIDKSQIVIKKQENKLFNLNKKLSEAIADAKKRYNKDSKKEKIEIIALKEDYKEAENEIKKNIFLEKQKIKKQETKKEISKSKPIIKKIRVLDKKTSTSSKNNLVKSDDYKKFNAKFEKECKGNETIPEYALMFKKKYGDVRKKYIVNFIAEKLNTDSHEFIETQLDNALKKIKEEKEKSLPLVEMAEIDNMTGHQFEDYLEEMFKNLGYESVVTKKSRDGGIDLILLKGKEKILVQAKRYGIANSVGVGAIRDVQAREKKEGATRLIVLTTSKKFSLDARKEADELNVELWDRTKLKELLRKAKKLKE